MWRKRSTKIAVLIALALTIALVILLYLNNATTPPTDFTKDERNLAALDVPNPTPLLPQQTDQDAAALYQKSIELYLTDPARYDRFVDSGTLQQFIPASYPALAPLIEARLLSR